MPIGGRREDVRPTNYDALEITHIQGDLKAARAVVQDLAILLVRHEQEIAALRLAALNAGGEILRRRSKKTIFKAAEALQAVRFIDPTESTVLIQALNVYTEACDLVISRLGPLLQVSNLEVLAEHKEVKFNARLLAGTFMELSEQAHTAIARNVSVAEGLRSALAAFIEI